MSRKSPIDNLLYGTLPNVFEIISIWETVTGFTQWREIKEQLLSEALGWT